MREESEGISGRASGRTGSEGERGELGWGAPVIVAERLPEEVELTRGSHRVEGERG